MNYICSWLQQRGVAQCKEYSKSAIIKKRRKKSSIAALSAVSSEQKRQTA
jgi:hypothetical protein